MKGRSAEGKDNGLPCRDKRAEALSGENPVKASSDIDSGGIPVQPRRIMERSESGAPIHRYKDGPKDFGLATGDSENIERISDHIERHIGPIARVFHELVSELVHIDVHIVGPTPERNFYTLVTSGMSDKPMRPPEEYSDLRYSELMICLPPDWPMTDGEWEKDENYWPIRMLKMLARFPHEYGTWLWAMHTMPHGDPPQPFASNTRLCGMILLPPVAAPPEFQELRVSDDKTIYFHALVPLHADEMDLKLKKGAGALFDGFNDHGVSEILNPARPSSLPAADKSWWKFGR